MERDKRDFFRKRSGSFKKKGWNQKKARSTSHEESPGSNEPPDTVYRILCPLEKIGGVIGKGGGVIKAIREETRAKITVSDAVPGSEERVIIIYSSPAKISKKQSGDDEEGSGADNGADNDEDGDLEPHCAAQDALLKVHDRILEEDIFGGMTFDDDNDNSDVTIRLLVPSNMVGCILGKKGDVITKLRRETGAGIRVLPSQHLPPCAMSTDELVQITGKPDVAKRALYEVSTRIHQNPRKDQPPVDIAMMRSGQSFHPPGGPVPPVQSWQGRKSDPYGAPPTSWMGERGRRPSSGHGGYDDVPAGPRGEPAEFSVKILCSGDKIRGVIGRGGSNVKQLEQDTGASVHVEDASSGAVDRVIRVSAVEAIWNPRSQTIDAILQLQTHTCEFTEGGTITSRLLVPTSKVGCIIGEGGHVINEMRRRTRADIRVISKDDRPSCASEDEEIVQISGNMAVARDALAEILSRVRVRSLRDNSGGGRPPPLGHSMGLASGGRFPGGRPSGPVAAGGPGGYEPYQNVGHDYEPLGHRGPRAAAGFLPSSNSSMKGVGGHEHEPRGYPGPRAAAGYDVSGNLDPGLPSAVASAIGMAGINIPNLAEIIGAMMKQQDPQASGSESVFNSQVPVAQTMYDPYMAAAAPNTNSQQLQYHPTTSAPQGSYPNVIEQQDPYSISNAQQSAYSQQAVYPDVNAAYQDVTTQQGSHQY